MTVRTSHFTFIQTGPKTAKIPVGPIGSGANTLPAEPAAKPASAPLGEANKDVLAVFFGITVFIPPAVPRHPTPSAKPQAMPLVVLTFAVRTATTTFVLHLFPVLDLGGIALGGSDKAKLSPPVPLAPPSPPFASGPVGASAPAQPPTPTPTPTPTPAPVASQAPVDVEAREPAAPQEAVVSESIEPTEPVVLPEPESPARLVEEKGKEAVTRPIEEPAISETRYIDAAKAADYHTALVHGLEQSYIDALNAPPPALPVDAHELQKMKDRRQARVKEAEEHQHEARQKAHIARQATEQAQQAQEEAQQLLSLSQLNQQTAQLLRTDDKMAAQQADDLERLALEQGHRAREHIAHAQQQAAQAAAANAAAVEADNKAQEHWRMAADLDDQIAMHGGTIG